MTFRRMPSMDELATASSAMNAELASHILGFTAQWARNDEEALELVNYMYEEITAHGITIWSELRWRILVDRVNNLSSQINNNVNRLARR